MIGSIYSKQHQRKLDAAARALIESNMDFYEEYNRLLCEKAELHSKVSKLLTEVACLKERLRYAEDRYHEAHRDAEMHRATVRVLRGED